MTSELTSLNNTNGQEETLTISSTTITFNDFTLLDKTNVDYYVITILDGDVIVSLDGDDPPTKAIWKAGESDTLSYADMAGATWIRVGVDARLKVVPCNDSRVNETKHIKKQQLFQVENVDATQIDSTSINATTGNITTVNSTLINTDSVKFDTSSSTVLAEGQLNWNSEDNVLQVGLTGGNVTLQIGQEMLLRCKAIGDDIDNGKVVYISGASGNNPEVTLADNTASITSNKVIGVATEDISQNSLGYVTVFGLVRDIPTNHTAAGSIIYLTTSGSFDDAAPSYPNYKVRVGYCLRSHATEGVILVYPDQRSNSVENIYNGEVYDDFRFPATTSKVSPVSNKPDFDETNVGLLFDPDSIETIYLIAQLPHSWKEGSSIEPHIHWQPTSTNTGSVVWRMEYKWTNINATESGSWTTVDITTAADGTTGKHQYASFGAVSGSGKTASSIISFKISRQATNVSDTYTADALYKEFDFHYAKDKLGAASI